MHARILVADDEKAVRESVTSALKREGFEVETAGDGKTAWERLAAERFDLAVLDITMPLLEGTAVLARLRAAKMPVPVIFLTSRDEELDRIAGLESGADDYISKPFSMGELIARIKAVLRRAGARESDGDCAARADSDADQYDSRGHGPGLKIISDNLMAFWDGCEVRLTVTEFRMLERLLHLSGEVVSRCKLMQYAFPLDNYASDRSADSHIKRLRKKLEDAGAPENCIETVYGAGYRMKGGLK